MRAGPTTHNIITTLRARQYQLLSVDVFDTLLWRRAAAPTDLFPLVGKALMAAGTIPQLPEETFKALRIQAELLARSDLCGDQAEISHQAIYEHFPGHILPTHCIQTAIDTELDVEAQLVEIDLETLAIIEAAETLKIPFVLVSDMYLSAQRIRKLIDCAYSKCRMVSQRPFPEPLKIFVSSEYGTGKQMALFARVVEWVDLKPRQILHIGDQVLSDQVGPTRHGLDAALVSAVPRWQQNIFEEEEQFYRMPLPGLDNGLRSLRIRASRSLGIEPTYETLGALVFGPVLYGFSKWVIGHTLKRGIDTVYCPLREGRLLGPLINRIARHQGLELQAVEMAMSRLVAKRAALCDASPSSLVDFLQTVHDLRPTEIAAALGLSAQAVMEVIEVSPLENTPLTDDGLATLCARLAEHRRLSKAILNFATEQRAQMLGYLEDVGFLRGDQPLRVICDVGWAGTIQKHLGVALHNYWEKPTILDGLYLGTLHQAHSLLWHGGMAQGYLFDGLQRPEERLSIPCRELMELVLMPDLGSTIMFSKERLPVSVPVRVSKSQLEQSKRVMHGIERYFDCALAFESQKSDFTAGIEEKERLLAILVRNGAAPTLDEVALFGNWAHETNAASDHIEPLIPAVNPLDFSYSNKRAEEIKQFLDTQKLYWPAGALLKYGGNDCANLVKSYCGKICPKLSTTTGFNGAHTMTAAWASSNDELIRYFSSPLFVLVFRLRALLHRFPMLYRPLRDCSLLWGLRLRNALRNRRGLRPRTTERIT